LARLNIAISTNDNKNFVGYFFFVSAQRNKLDQPDNKIEKHKKVRKKSGACHYASIYGER